MNINSFFYIRPCVGAAIETIEGQCVKPSEEKQCEEQCTGVGTMTHQATTTTPAVRGRPFPKGNGGRRPGSKNRSSLIIAALSEGGEEELVRKALEIAMAGDVIMLKFFLSRILPRERAITINLPRMEFADDAVEALGTIMAAVGEGRITPSEAHSLAALVNSYAHAIYIADVVKRMEVLEAKIKGTE